MKLFARVKHFVRFSRKCDFGWSLWNLVHGFSKSTVELNGITRKNYKAFLSDREYWYGHPYNGLYSRIIDNKIYLPYLLKDYPEHVPQYYYFVNNGISAMGAEGVSSHAAFEDFLNLLKKNGKLVLKHIGSSCGKGFYLLEYKADGYLLSGETMTETELKSFMLSLRNYVVSEYVQQHEYALKVNSSSLNTIRMLCVRGAEDNSFHVVRCFHRFGANGSLVDNIGGGNGCLQFVNIQTGEIEPDGMVNNDNKGEKYSSYIIHPSGKDLTGTMIPGFQEIRDKVIEISNSLPFLKYVGWDIAVTRDGFKIIEANSLTSLGVLQRKGGFLEDPQMKHLFKK